LYETSSDRGAPALAWLVMMTVGLSAALGLWRLSRRGHALRRPSTVAPAG
jgi:hypothetical protein